MRLIDADAIKRRVVIVGSEQCKACPLADMIAEIENAPRIEAEPIRHGHWIKGGEAYIEAQTIQEHICSLCGNRTLEADNYCGNCGAKMDEEVEG